MPDASSDVQRISANIQTLECFVVDNDDLHALEERIGRFNIFDALRIVGREVKHSDFLAWLLDPNESHGQGSLFLRAVLMDLFKTARDNGFVCPVSPIELDGEDLRGVEIRREWRKLDLLITCDQPQFVVAIENKIHSSEHSNQLARYQTTVNAEFGGAPSMYVFLTVEGEEASEDDWVPYSYGHLHRVFERVRNANENAIGDEVRTFVDHYLRLIRGRLMDDPTITQLCQRIYKNHRQAIDLIIDKAGLGTGRMLTVVENVLQEQGRWHIVKRTPQRLRFVPKEWMELLPPIGKEASVNSRLWLNLVFRVTSDSLIFLVSVRPTTDSELRTSVIARLTDECGFKTFFKNRGHIGGHYTALGREMIAKIKDDEGPEDGILETVARKKLEQLTERLARVPEVLQPILEEWERSHESTASK